MSSNRGVLRNLKRFLRNESGNYAIMFGLTVFPILGGVALAVDYTNIQRYRGAVQDSLDAAALASAKEFSSGVTGTALEDYAKDFFDANLPNFIPAGNVDLGVSLVDTQIIDTNGDPATVKTVKLDASLEYDSFVAQVLGYDKFNLGISSQVALGNITVEVAMVMDNSGSMGSKSKIDSARTTAKDLVETIFNAASNSNKPNPVSFSLVPFSGMVNIGSDNANAAWMDTNGWSSIHNENLDWANTYLTANAFEKKGAGYREKVNGNWEWKSRYSVFDMLGVDWGGCVEMRPWPYNTTDDAAITSGVSSTADYVNQDSSSDILDKLFVPFFAPAEPYSKYAYQGRSGGGRRHRGSGGTSTQYSDDWHNYGNDYLMDWVRPDPSNLNSLQQIYYDTSFNSPYNNGVIQSNQNMRQDWVWRYQAAALNSSNYYGSYDGKNSGPNDGCYSNPVTELTTSQTTIDSEIDKMQAEGMTNIQQGVAWGWRSLSPGEPFTGGRDPSDTTNRKYMIVLTDGNNTYNSSYTPNGSYYGSWGFDKQGRMDEGLTASDLADTPYVGASLNSFEKKMNAHTVQTCNNAKADGVSIFTIAFDVDDGSSVKDMLQACSGSGIVNNKLVMKAGTFYYDVGASNLDTAMEAIASQISEMRIIQ
ncbi:MAG: pilus assembly protein [Salaquimonas sp.]|nr:pilus assembly protein [Salaquimonas sp.]